MTELIYIHVHNSYDNILHAFTRQVNTLSVTIFHHTHTPLGVWYYVISICFPYKQISLKLQCCRCCSTETLPTGIPLTMTQHWQILH